MGGLRFLGLLAFPAPFLWGGYVGGCGLYFRGALHLFGCGVADILVGQEVILKLGLVFVIPGLKLQ